MRTFVAIELPQAVKQRVAEQQQRLDRLLADADLRGCIRWIDAANLHLTLRFLGETTPAQVEALAGELATAASGRGSFSLDVKGIGCFPSFNRPRIVWLGFVGAVDALCDLQSAVEAEVRRLAFAAEEKPFSPHLTIGRARRDAVASDVLRAGRLLDQAQVASLAPSVAGTDSMRFTVEEIVHMASDLRPDGPIYTTLRRVALVRT